MISLLLNTNACLQVPILFKILGWESNPGSLPHFLSVLIPSSSQGETKHSKFDGWWGGVDNI